MHVQGGEPWLRSSWPSTSCWAGWAGLRPCRRRAGGPGSMASLHTCLGRWVSAVQLLAQHQQLGRLEGLGPCRCRAGGPGRKASRAWTGRRAPVALLLDHHQILSAVAMPRLCQCASGVLSSVNAGGAAVDRAPAADHGSQASGRAGRSFCSALRASVV